MSVRRLSLFSRSLLAKTKRTMSSQTPQQASPSTRATNDWSAAQYLKFAQQRGRPIQDLISQIPLTSPTRIIDVGCGPGNSTKVLATRWPDANISGMDSSPNMIETARKTLPNAQFTVGDLNTYTPEEPADLIFSNAVFHWVKYDDRIPVMKRLIQSLKPGGAFAIQIPDNFTEHSHEAMCTVAEQGPWAETLGRLQTSNGPFQTPQELYNELKPLCSSVDLWHTFYHHSLSSHEDIVEWVKSTGLKPFIDPLGPQEREGFLAAYLQRLKELYPVSSDGSVILRYPRLFMVAVRA